MWIVGYFFYRTAESWSDYPKCYTWCSFQLGHGLNTVLFNVHCLCTVYTYVYTRIYIYIYIIAIKTRSQQAFCPNTTCTTPLFLVRPARCFKNRTIVKVVLIPPTERECNVFLWTTAAGLLTGSHKRNLQSAHLSIRKTPSNNSCWSRTGPQSQK